MPPYFISTVLSPFCSFWEVSRPPQGPFWNQAALYTMEMVQCAGLDAMVMVEIGGKSSYRPAALHPSVQPAVVVWWSPSRHRWMVSVWHPPPPCLMMWRGFLCTTRPDLYTWKSRIFNSTLVEQILKCSWRTALTPDTGSFFLSVLIEDKHIGFIGFSGTYWWLV